MNPDRLRSFLKVLPKGYRYAFEFRDPTWLKEEIYDLLREYKAALCIYELDHFISPMVVMADFVYVRLHGPKGTYSGNYSLKTLKKWAAFFRKEARKGKDIYCYFDNDQAGYAPLNAQTVRSLLRNNPSLLKKI